MTQVTIGYLIGLKKLRLALLRHGPRTCAYCGRRVGKRTATLDHRVPRSLGGSLAADNVSISCGTCNLAKRDRTPEQWARDILSSRAG